MYGGDPGGVANVHPCIVLERCMTDTYRVKPMKGKVAIDVRVPGSKSVTNRALLLATLAKGESVLKGAGMSEDSRVFIEALRSLGVSVEEVKNAEGELSLRVFGCGGVPPVKEAVVHVGSAGTAARFLTAMTALSDGRYEMTSSEQMKARPMRELLEALEQLGAGFSFPEKPYAFPFTVTGRRHADNAGKRVPAEVPLNIDRSSQFLSALLLCGPMLPEGFSIRLTGTRTALSYVSITERMMREFGYEPENENNREPNRYTVTPSQSYRSREYEIEPDVSAACYFYAMAAVCGGRARVRGVRRGNSQGDMRFPELLVQMGCRIEEEEGDIVVSRDPPGALHGVSVNMSDFSDQTMTLAAIAPFADSPTTITGVAHIRGQESNRIRAIVTELTRLGVRCEEREDGVKIWSLTPGDEVADEVKVETYEDHRMAMAFAVTGLRRPGVFIENPGCCRKTFENYFHILDRIYTQNNTTRKDTAL